MSEEAVTPTESRKPSVRWSDGFERPIIADESEQASSMDEEEAAEAGAPFSRDWYHPLVSCDDISLSLCIDVTFCHPCMLGRFWSALKHKKPEETACEPVCLILLCPVYPPLLTIDLRAAVRKKYFIKDECPTDGVAACFCMPCALCQMYREMRLRGSPIAPFVAARPSVSSLRQAIGLQDTMS